MPRMILFGPGYTGARVAAALRERDWEVETAGRAAVPHEVAALLARATHVLSTVPPTGETDPILDAYGAAIGRVGWIGYLSSTGVYGDTKGGWVDESAPLSGRRSGRVRADEVWQALGARVFRLPGIYGPGRAMIDRLRAGQAHRIDLPGQVFCRVHVDDIVSGVLAATERGPAGVYNLADDLPAPQNDVVAFAARMLGMAVPPLMPIDALALSPAARAFYGENRRVANGKAKRLLEWRPRYPTYREGLRALPG